MDALSRRADHVTGEEDNENVTMLPDNLFVNLVAEDLREQVKQATQSDVFATNIIKCLTEKSPPPLRTALSDWTNDDGIILYKGKSYIPENAELRHSIIKEYHWTPWILHNACATQRKLLVARNDHLIEEIY